MESDLPSMQMPSGRELQKPRSRAHMTRIGEPRSRVLIARLDDALRDFGDRSALNRNPLACLRQVRGLAASTYSGRLMPCGLALRQVIGECVAGIRNELRDEPGLTVASRYLELRASGAKCSQIAKELGLSREHISRTIRKRALELLAEEFANAIERRE